jgi:predicted short-subunit dehydrogenase-like oxidoreductase (DUF2520 family)
MTSHIEQLPNPSDQTFAVIGAGRVGISLGYLLKRAGCSVTGCFARSESSKALAAKWLKAPVRRTMKEAAADADCLLLTVPDSAIESVSTELAEDGSIGAGTFVLHTAGAFGVAPLQPAVESGARAIAFHPLQAVPDVEGGTAHIPGSWVGVTATTELFGWAEALAAVIGCKAFEVPEEKRPLYHAAAAMSSNYLVTLSWLVQQTFPNLEPFIPLMRGTLDNIERAGPESALTGAIVRGDVETIERHLEFLQREARHIEPYYRELGRATLELAARSGRIDTTKQQRVAAVLETQP